VTFLVTCIASHLTLPFKLLLALRSATFGNIQFYRHGSVRILVLVIVIKLLSLEVVVTAVWNISRLASRGNVVASFHSAFVKVVVDFDCCADEFIEILDLLAGSHKFVLNIFLQTTAVHSY
jgi:hypothetical protein